MPETEVEGLLRQLAPQALGAVVRRYGDFDTAEDATQEALLAAATQWAKDGIPANPRAWLITVASRRLTDLLRSEQARPRRADLGGLGVRAVRHHGGAAPRLQAPGVGRGGQGARLHQFAGLFQLLSLVAPDFAAMGAQLVADQRLGEVVEVGDQDVGGGNALGHGLIAFVDQLSDAAAPS